VANINAFGNPSVEYNTFTGSTATFSYMGNAFIHVGVYDATEFDVSMVESVDYIMANPIYYYSDKGAFVVDGVDNSSIVVANSSVTSAAVDFIPAFNLINNLSSINEMNITTIGMPYIRIDNAQRSVTGIDVVQAVRFESIFFEVTDMDITITDNNRIMVGVIENGILDVSFTTDTNVYLSTAVVSTFNVTFDNNIQYGMLFSDVSIFDVSVVESFFVTIYVEVAEVSDLSEASITITPNVHVMYATYDVSNVTVSGIDAYNIAISDHTHGNIVVSIEQVIDVELFNTVMITIKTTDIGISTYLAQSWLDDFVIRSDINRTIVIPIDPIADVVIRSDINRTIVTPIELSMRA
jgi:hypothetical protein